jgi:hypothetical protein
LDEFRAALHRLAALADVPPAYLIETDDPAENDGQLFDVETREGRLVYIHVIGERGANIALNAEASARDLLGAVFLCITKDMAMRQARKPGYPQYDPRRDWFPIQIRLLRLMDAHWAEEEEKRQAEVVFDDTPRNWFYT